MQFESLSRLTKFAVFAFVILQLADAVLTGIGVHYHGIELEANPIAAVFITKWGLVKGILAEKALALGVFFGILWYSIDARWSFGDLFRMLRGSAPKRDRSYAIRCFHVVAVFGLALSLYAGGQWVYLFLGLPFSQ